MTSRHMHTCCGQSQLPIWQATDTLRLPPLSRLIVDEQLGLSMQTFRASIRCRPPPHMLLEFLYIRSLNSAGFASMSCMNCYVNVDSCMCLRIRFARQTRYDERMHAMIWWWQAWYDQRMHVMTWWWQTWYDQRMHAMTCLLAYHQYSAVPTATFSVQRGSHSCKHILHHFRVGVM